ncbi:unnamed protein product, partial [Allacma fusca]
ILHNLPTNDTLKATTTKLMTKTSIISFHRKRFQHVPKELRMSEESG